MLLYMEANRFVRISVDWYLYNKTLKKTLWPLFMDWIQLPHG